MGEIEHLETRNHRGVVGEESIDEALVRAVHARHVSNLCHAACAPCNQSVQIRMHASVIRFSQPLHACMQVCQCQRAVSQHCSRQDVRGLLPVPIATPHPPRRRHQKQSAAISSSWKLSEAIRSTSSATPSPSSSASASSSYLRPAEKAFRSNQEQSSEPDQTQSGADLVGAPRDVLGRPQLDGALHQHLRAPRAHLLREYQS